MLEIILKISIKKPMYEMRQTHEIWILYQINYYSLKTAAAVFANKSQKWINLGKKNKVVRNPKKNTSFYEPIA